MQHNLKKKLDVMDTLKEGWEKTYGIKTTFWAAILILFVIGLVFVIAETITKEAAPGQEYIIQALSQFILFLLNMGLIYMGVSRALDRHITYRDVFKPFAWDYIFRLIGYHILLMAISLIFVLAIVFFAFFGIFWIIAASIIATLAGIFILTRLILAVPYILDLKSGPFTAIKLSWRATADHFWEILAILILLFIIIVVSTIPFGIGLIWTIPLGYITTGVIYRKLTQSQILTP